MYGEIAKKLLVNPDDPRALVERQWCVTGAKNRELNLALAKRALDIAPSRFEARFNYASALMNFNRPYAAIDHFRNALVVTPDSHKAATVHHIGLAHHDAGDLDTAMKCYREALALGTELEIHRSMAIAKLAGGDLSGLWDFEVEHYQAWRKPIFQSGIPRWRGEDLTGKTIIIAHEQGFGDTIQFCRAVDFINAEKVLWTGPKTITDLISDHFDFDGIVPEDGPFEADYYASPMSAFAALGFSYDDVGGYPYMTAEPFKLPDRGDLKVGLVWRGSPGYARDFDRSFTIEDYAPLFEIPGAAFYSLQYGEFADDVHHAGLTGFVADLTPTIKGWRNTASALAAMDVLVSMDTSTAHLAGALGVPTLLLLNTACCWRWMQGRTDTPWYNEHKLFRQVEPGEWKYPIQQVVEDLHGQIARKHQSRNARQACA